MEQSIFRTWNVGSGYDRFDRKEGTVGSSNINRLIVSQVYLVPDDYGRCPILGLKLIPPIKPVSDAIDAKQHGPSTYRHPVDYVFDRPFPKAVEIDANFKRFM